MSLLTHTMERGLVMLPPKSADCFFQSIYELYQCVLCTILYLYVMMHFANIMMLCSAFAPCTSLTIQVDATVENVSEELQQVQDQRSRCQGESFVKEAFFQEM